MLLSPQHLQQWDRYVHHQMDERLRVLEPLAWGFTQLEIDRDALRNGRFAVASARGVFPDGTVFSVPEEDAPPASRPIEEHFGARLETLKVWLGVPAARTGRSQLGEAAHPGSPGPRYSPDTQDLPDDYDGGATRPITLARRNLCVLFPEDALDEHDLLQAAELKRSPEGRYVLREEYVPPSLAIGASPELMRWLESIYNQLLAKSDNLSGKRRVQGGVADFTVGDLNSFGTLLRSNEMIPVLAHHVAQRGAHPEQVYRELASLAGVLTTFSAEHTPRQVPAYQHEALGATFKDLHALLTSLLMIREDSRAARIPLEKKDEAIWVGQITDARMLEPHAALYLGASASLEKDRLLREFPKKVKVAAFGQINSIVELALDGVPLTFAQDPPAALPVRPNHFYFKLNPGGDAWDGVKGAQNVAIYTADLPGVSLDLLGLRG